MTGFWTTAMGRLLDDVAALQYQRERVVDVLRHAVERGAVPVEPSPLAAAGVPGPQPIALSPDQERAVETCLTRLRSQRVVTLAGAAGTGKTTTVRAVLRELDSPYVLTAPTGKAALRLAEVTGEEARTIHRIAYEGATETDDGELLFHRREAGSVGGGSVGGGKDYWRQIAAALRGGDRAVVVIDEASMVGQRLRDDLVGPFGCLGPNVSVLAIGDHCQLPPVNAEPAFDLANADALLEKVHRQDGGPLLDLVTYLRTERAVLSSSVARRFGLEPERMSAADLAGRIAVQVAHLDRDWPALVATNRQRSKINDLTRAMLGFPRMGEGPQVGEQVIVLDNNYAVLVMNGEIGKVVRSRVWAVGEHVGYWVDIDFGDRVARVAVPDVAWISDDPRQRGRVPRAVRDDIAKIVYQGGACGQEARPVLRRLVGMAPAYAMTVHKSQGSEWPAGAFVLSRAGWLKEDAWRLSYTAATRFCETATFAVGCM